MHGSATTFTLEQLSPAELRDALIVEVGSNTSWGTVRDALLKHAPRAYVGLDMSAGPGVDLIERIEECSLPDDHADIVVSNGTMEHVEFWRDAISQMKRILRPGGVMLITAAGPGFHRHDHPSDYWRFTPDHMSAIFGDFDIDVCVPDPDPGNPGVCLRARKPLDARPAIDLSLISVDTVQ